MIDDNGFRLNVGIILSNGSGKLFWGRRAGMDAWQFPQGGVKPRETLEQALMRELREETGLDSSHVKVIGSTRDWLRYRLPKDRIRRGRRPLCIGQKQRWFALHMLADEDSFDLGCCSRPEFDDWRWVDYWHPLDEVIHFKRDVYRKALTELEPLLRPGPGSKP